MHIKITLENLRKSGPPKKNVNERELEMGMEVEREHTDDPAVAKKIALDHLSEPGQQNYYTKLKKMEKKK